MKGVELGATSRKAYVNGSASIIFPLLHISRALVSQLEPDILYNHFGRFTVRGEELVEVRLHRDSTLDGIFTPSCCCE